MKPIRIRSAASQLRGAKVKANVAKGDALANLLVEQVRGYYPRAQREVRFHYTRKWRFDLVLYPLSIAACPVAVEIEGGAWVSGAHSRGAHFRSDIEKYAEAAALGWIVLRVMPEHVTNGKAAEWLKRIAERAP